MEETTPSGTPAPVADQASMAPAHRSLWRKVRRIVYPVLALLASWLFLMVIMAGAAAWYTSRPVFCASCHNMVPYYESWQKSNHRDVTCVECHFPPGLGGKVRGKVLGLVQLLKYVTSSAGPRPAAEIPDASCLRSGCHETRLLSGVVDFRVQVKDDSGPGREIVIPFDHTPHLQPGRRGKTLRCTSCHSQIVQGSHMTVTATTCFLCHFKDQPFNERLSACTHCHQIPEGEFFLGGKKFTHTLAFNNGVDCRNCHADLIRGKGEVPRKQCQSCHNREGDLARYDDHDFIHSKHVSEHKVDCTQCHMPIEHNLSRDKIQDAVADCQACHPKHHQVQVNILQGAGMETIAGQSNPMLAVRAECRTCHRLVDDKPKKGELVRGSYDMCAMCHNAGEVAQFKTDHVDLQTALPLLRDSLGKVEAAGKTAGLAKARAEKIAAETAAMRHDLDLLITGNDVHNMHMAAKLVRQTLKHLKDLCGELKIEPPKVNLPASILEEPKSAHGDNGKAAAPAKETAKP
jgi:nitrate/TMAO reductase-like tetraheme cytochrome c subunit